MNAKEDDKPFALLIRLAKAIYFIDPFTPRHTLGAQNGVERRVRPPFWSNVIDEEINVPLRPVLT